MAPMEKSTVNRPQAEAQPDCTTNLLQMAKIGVENKNPNPSRKEMTTALCCAKDLVLLAIMAGNWKYWNAMFDAMTDEDNAIKIVMTSLEGISEVTVLVASRANMPVAAKDVA